MEWVVFILVCTIFIFVSLGRNNNSSDKLPSENIDLAQSDSANVLSESKNPPGALQQPDKPKVFESGDHAAIKELVIEDRSQSSFTDNEKPAVHKNTNGEFYVPLLHVEKYVNGTENYSLKNSTHISYVGVNEYFDSFIRRARDKSQQRESKLELMLSSGSSADNSDYLYEFRKRRDVMPVICSQNIANLYVPKKSFHDNRFYHFFVLQDYVVNKYQNAYSEKELKTWHAAINMQDAIFAGTPSRFDMFGGPGPSLN